MAKINYQSQIDDLSNFCKVLTELAENDLKIQHDIMTLTTKMIACENKDTKEKIYFSDSVNTLSKMIQTLGNRNKQSFNSIKTISDTITHLSNLQDKLI